MLFIPQQLLSDMTSLGASKSGDYSASESDDIINFDNIFSMIDTEDSDLSNILSDAHENLTAIVHELPQAEEFSEMWQEFAAALPENMPINADEARQKSQVVLEQL